MRTYKANRPPKEYISGLYQVMTWTYHAEAMAKNEADRAAARFEREHVNGLLMKAAT